MAEVDALVLQMSADVRKMEAALRRIAGETDKRTRQVEARFNKMNSHIKRSGDMIAADLTRSFAAIGIAAAIGQVTDYADTWTSAQNKIAAAGVAQGNLAETMRDLVGVAKETGSSFSATADLYAKVQRSADSLGLSQAQVLKITEQVNKAFVAGGASASEQASGILQLGQALGSGVLQGDELRSLRENAPLLAQAIADEFKTTIAGLKQLGADGELASGRVAKAILNATTIQDQFARTTRTVAQSVENLRTEFTRYVGESRTLGAVTQTLSGFLDFVTRNIDSLADAAVVAASVLGGTLAAGAIARLGIALFRLGKDINAAKTAMEGLKASAAFLGGPVGAAILAIGTGLLYMANQAVAGQSAVENLADSIGEYRDTQNKIISDTERLTAAQQTLRDAMAGVGDTAVSVATQQVDAIERVLAANKKLAESQRSNMQVQLNEARKQLNSRSDAGKGSRVDQFLGLLTEPFRESKVDDMTTGEIRSLLERQLGNRNMTRDQFRTFASNTIMNGGTLSNDDSWTNALVAALDTAEAKVTDLEVQIQELDKQIANLGKDGGDELTTTMTTATKAASGYETALEKVTAVIAPLQKAHAEEAAALAKTASDYEGLAAVVRGVGADQTYLKEQEEKLDKARQANAESNATRSRIALQALLEFIKGTDDLAAAIAKVPSLANVLTGGDTAILKAELTRQTAELTEAVLVGEDKITAEFNARMRQIMSARSAAIAQGVEDLAAFDRAMDDAYSTASDARMKLWDEKHPMTGVRDLSDLVDQIAGDDPYGKIVKDAHAAWVRDGVIPSEAMLEMRETMRNSVKDALREGIRTGDWAESFKSILADGVTSALDKALDRVGDWLADQVFGSGGQKGFLDYALAGITSAFGFPIAGARANGGPVSAGKTYLVGERGPELLTMGRQSGHILNASQINGMLAAPAGGGGTTVINANLVVQGSVDSVTMPVLRAAMQSQARQIMANVPHAVNATLMDNRTQQRRI